MKLKPQEAVDDCGSAATSGAEIIVPSERVLEREKTDDVMRIDYTSEHTSDRQQIVSGQATGPRTDLGKQRSSRNAIKHGIFSEGILLKGESRAQFESLRTQLREALRPEGGAEELLVDKLVSISWRYRRFLTAETAEIRKSIEFVQWDQLIRQGEEAEEIGRKELFDDETGLMWKIQNPEILERCLELLSELRQGIETTGFDETRDTAVLHRIYGEKMTNLRGTLREDYQLWFATSETPEEERAREGYATPEECKKNVLNGIDAQIRRLKSYRKRSAAIESQRTEVEILRRIVPESSGLDRLLRYETSLERAFDRTLSQLERLQRLRLGQPVAPRIDVNMAG